MPALLISAACDSARAWPARRRDPAHSDIGPAEWLAVLPEEAKAGMGLPVHTFRTRSRSCLARRRAERAHRAEDRDPFVGTPWHKRVPARIERVASAGPAREVILATLNEHRWRMVEAARALGVSHTTLWRWLRDLELLPRRPAHG
jgi:DNA-binding NtrC family response regulator